MSRSWRDRFRRAGVRHLVDARANHAVDVVFREIWRGRIWSAAPARLIEHAPDVIVSTFDPRSRIVVSGPTTGRNQRKRDLSWTLAVRGALPHYTRTTTLYAPGAAWSVRLAFAPRPGGTDGWFAPGWTATSGDFRGWYVNLEEPWRRTQIGFDTMDEMLDLEVAPDLSTWRTKDSDELDEAVAMEVVTGADADRLRGTLDEVVDLVERRAFPFDQDPACWAPDPDWPTPRLARNWATVPIA